MLRESGIYDRLIKVGLNPSRVGPDAGETRPTIAHEFETLMVKQMRGIFVLYLMFGSISIIAFVIEIRKLLDREKRVDKDYKRRRTIHVIAMHRKKSSNSYWEFS